MYQRTWFFKGIIEGIIPYWVIEVANSYNLVVNATTVVVAWSCSSLKLNFANFYSAQGSSSL